MKIVIDWKQFREAFEDDTKSKTSVFCELVRTAQFELEENEQIGSAMFYKEIAKRTEEYKDYDKRN